MFISTHALVDFCDVSFSEETEGKSFDPFWNLPTPLHDMFTGSDIEDPKCMWSLNAI